MPDEDEDLPCLVDAGGARAMAVRAEVAGLAAAAAANADASQASSTRRAYLSRWRAFQRWCERMGVVALPADAGVVAAYITAIAPTKSVATLNGILAAIGSAHRRSNFPPPASATLTEIWAGIRREEAAPQRQVRALVTADLRKVITKLPDTAAGARDKAMLLVGFAAALRRSELVALELETGARIFSSGCIGFVAGGLKISLLRSKTDQEGRGQIIAIPRGKTKLCPVTAMRDWTQLAGIKSGPIFREVDRHGRIGNVAISDRAAADVIKRAVSRAGFDPALFSGHSLRAGFVTEAAKNGVPIELIMRQTRHTKAETVQRYIREADAFSRNAASKVGL